MKKNKSINGIRKEENIKLITLYFRYRNAYNMGYQSYKIFKFMMSHITNINNYTYIRNVFETMLSRGTFKLKFKNKNRFYIFNPYNLDEENIEYDINKKKFIINFN